MRRTPLAALTLMLTFAPSPGEAQEIKRAPGVVRPAEAGVLTVFVDKGVLELAGGESSPSPFGGEDVFEVIGEATAGIIGEKIIGEKIIGEKVIGEKVIGEKREGGDGPRAVVVRGVRTGRTLELLPRSGTSGLEAVAVGERLRVKAGTKKGAPELGAVSKGYTLSEVSLAGACCAVEKVSAEGFVSVRGRERGALVSFAVPDAKIRESLRKGQAVSLDREGRWAFVHTSAVRGLKGQQATYSFKVSRDGDKGTPAPLGGRRP